MVKWLAEGVDTPLEDSPPIINSDCEVPAVPNLLVHPSRGRKDGRENLERSLAIAVSFSDPRYALRPDQLGELALRHPDGTARFWGTYDHNRKKIERIAEGDPVLFTGQGGVWAIGTVGYRFENEDFARALWNVHPEKGAYRHVYSLTSFEEVDIPYAVVNEPLGNKASNHFQQMSVYAEGRAQAVIDTLRLDLQGGSHTAYADADERLATELAGTPRVDRLAIEQSRTPLSTRVTTGSVRVVRRGEALLVATYAATLGDSRFWRTSTPAGVTDLEVETASGIELIEAKSDTTAACIRAVLAQLLHYASAAETAPATLAGLFPRRPQQDHVALLNRYGIDVLFRTRKGRFQREAAPSSTRDLLRSFWS